MSAQLGLALVASLTPDGDLDDWNALIDGADETELRVAIGWLSGMIRMNWERTARELGVPVEDFIAERGAALAVLVENHHRGAG